MPAREVTLVERRDAAYATALAMERAAERYMDALVGGDIDAYRAASAALDAAVRDHRRTASALEKTEKRLARRAELTTSEEDGRGS